MKKRAAPKRSDYVRYLSPFGSPAVMVRAEAERHLAEDDEHWLVQQSAGNLSAAQRQSGPPRIEELPG